MNADRESKSKIEKAIIGIVTAFNEHRSKKFICVNKDFVRINCGGSDFWNTFFYLSVLVFLPVGWTLYYLLVTENFSALFSLIIVSTLCVAFIFNYLLEGQNILIFDFKNKYIKVEKASAIFKPLYKEKKTAFSNIEKTHFDIKFRNRGNFVMQFVVCNKDKTKIILYDFCDDYRSSAIANRIKLLVDEIIRLEK